MNANQDELRLVAPGMDYRQQLLDYKRETLAIEPELAGDAGLDTSDTVEEWLERLERCRRPDTCPPGLVPSSTFLSVRLSDKRLVGLVDIRHTLNDLLLNSGGHIGYSVRPDERGKGYSKIQLRLALQKCREMGLDRVLLTCGEDNGRSRRTIEACGGVLEDMRVNPEGRRTLRFWIAL